MGTAATEGSVSTVSATLVAVAEGVDSSLGWVGSITACDARTSATAFLDVFSAVGDGALVGGAVRMVGVGGRSVGVAR